MKSNLDNLFKNSEGLEKDGIWFYLEGEEVGFRLKRFGGFNSTIVKKAMNKHLKPYAKQIELGLLSQEKETAVMTRVFVEASLVDWKGVEIDGQEVAFEKELAVKFLTGLPELTDTLSEHATDSKNYREDLGNS